MTSAEIIELSMLNAAAAKEHRARGPEILSLAESMDQAVAMLWTDYAQVRRDEFPELGGWTVWLLRGREEQGWAVTSVPRREMNWQVSPRNRETRLANAIAASACAPSLGELLRWLDAGSNDWTAVAIRAVLAQEGNPDAQTLGVMVALGMFPTEEGQGRRLLGIADGVANPRADGTARPRPE